MTLRTTAVALSCLLFVSTPGCGKTAEGPVGQNEAGGAPEKAAKDEGAQKPVVEDSAVNALKEMSGFLMAAKTLEIDTVGSLDVITNNGQRIQLDGTTNYKVRRPGFVISYESDIKSRKFIYDGKNFTIYSPKLGFYATAPAPPTNNEALDAIYDKFGISLPLEDLFRWGDGATEDRLKALQSGYKVGTATIDGVKTDHYAFREPNIDWELWIQQGDQPWPRKIAIVNRNDPEKPAFVSRISWKLNPTFTDADFTFVPDANAKRIQLASFKASGG